MPRLFSIVALLLTVAVPGGGQCADVCAFLALNPPVEAASLPPCHQAPQKQAADPACAHHDIVAEQQLAGTLEASSAIALGPVAELAQSPAFAETALPPGVSHRPPPHRPPALRILRI